MHYELTILKARTLSDEYAKDLKCKYPTKWDWSKIAGIDWMHGFRKIKSPLNWENVKIRVLPNFSLSKNLPYISYAVI